MPTTTRRDRLCDEIVALLPALRGFARRFEPNSDAADDLVQEAIVRALANLDKFEEGTRLRSWLFTIIRNTFCTQYGLRKREPVGVDDCVSLHRSCEPQQEWAYRMVEFQAAFQQLAYHYRAAIDAVLFQGMSYEDAAKYCGCPPGTLKSRVNRGRLILARSICADSSAGGQDALRYDGGVAKSRPSLL
ncbi:sigma-70 family RNA polymerase sigma factor [Rhizobium terrae]|uniref:sigma-70 family RNA polymerase sigma factor n=1 Tax=Rhizobium terrae TaxID=2171756 RepID=UPI000E3EDC49|nr:sigma-70 family RNA polymerase sigma factor [Rhizobium terrae]